MLDNHYRLIWLQIQVIIVCTNNNKHILDIHLLSFYLSNINIFKGQIIFIQVYNYRYIFLWSILNEKYLHSTSIYIIEFFKIKMLKI